MDSNESLNRINNYVNFLNECPPEELQTDDKNIILAAIKALENNDNSISRAEFGDIDHEIAQFKKENQGTAAVSKAKVVALVSTQPLMQNQPARFDSKFATNYVLTALDHYEKIVWTANLLNSIDFSQLPEDQKLELAGSCAESGIDLFCNHVEKFQIQNDDLRFQIAEHCLFAKDHFFQFLPHFNLSSIDHLAKLVSIVADFKEGGADYDPALINVDTNMYKDLFEFTQHNGTDFIQLMSVAIKQSSHLNEHLREFIPPDRHDLLVETLKIVAQNANKNVPVFAILSENGITDAEEQFEILQAMARDNPSVFMQQLQAYDQGFNISEKFDDQQKQKLLEAYLEKIETIIPGELEKFGIERDRTVSILEKMSSEKGAALVGLLPHLDLTHDQYLKFASNMIEKFPKEVAQFIAYFQFEVESERLDLAIKCAAAGVIAPYVQNFKLTDPEQLQKILLLNYDKNPHETMDHVSDFGITDRDFLYNFFSKAAQDGARIGGAHLALLPDLENSKKMQLASFCAMHNPLSLLWDIGAFHIASAEDLYQLALICADSGNAEFAAHVMNFGITDPQLLKQIATRFIRAWAKDQGDAVPKTNMLNMDRFNFTSDDFRDLLTVALRENPNAAPWFLFKMHHQDPEARLLSNVERLLSFMKLPNPDKYITIFQPMIEDLKKLDVEVTELENLVTKIKVAPNDQRRLFAFLTLLDKTTQACSMALLARLSLDKGQFERLNQQEIFSKILSYQQPSGAWTLFTSLVDTFAATSTAESEAIDKFLATTKSAATGKEFMALLLKKLLLQGIDAAALQDFMGVIFNTVQNFKDGKKATDLIEFLVELVKSTTLDSTTKKLLEESLCTDVNNKMRADYDEQMKGKKLAPKQIEQGFIDYKKKKGSEPYLHDSAVGWLTILRFEKPELVTQYLSGKPLSQILENEFITSILDRPIDGFYEKYQNTFAKFRIPNAIFQYAGSIAKLHDKKAAASLALFAASVLEGTFHQMRYSTDLNPHLQKINEKHSDILEKWKTNLKPIALSDKYVVVESDDPCDLILCGTEVFGSCQHVLKNADKNKALLGYLMNGTNKMIKVSTSEKGAIEARCMLRLLWDGDRPVLFKEYVYPDPCPPEMQEAISAMAEMKARELGVPLLEVPLNPVKGAIVYKKEVESLGGNAPYDYADALQKVTDNCIYKIPHANLIYDPGIGNSSQVGIFPPEIM